MDLLVNQIYFGFLLESIEKVEDIHSTAYLFRHMQSGALLLYLRNTDRNRVFTVAFKTPPEDDCGTPHILEHSVLCGSRKYQAKDPFNELAKGSLNTFLNAMTYADKTMYPVASCNEKDFHNLMDVYLDAVFYPRIYEKKEIFQQEGWRYILHDADKPLEITGVVYNEMKGALSDPESLLNLEISRSIFGRTTYGFESGGDPEAIPDLSYEDFLAFHQKHYHPSNAYFYLYGDLDLCACLKHIHEEYLAAFTAAAALPAIAETPCQNKGLVLQESYPASEESAGEGGYLAYSLKVGKCIDPERIMALQILSYVLLETNASPLKTALLDAGLCEETEGWFDSSIYEMVFSIIGKNAAADAMQLFRDVIDTTCKRLCAEGIPKDLLQSALRKYDFLLREEDYGSTPKGLIYCSRLMKRWLHGEEPLAGLRSLTLIEKLKKASESGYFEQLLAELFIENEDKTYMIFSPEKGKAAQAAEKQAKRLQERKDNFSDTELAQIQEENRRLDAFQKAVDPPEVLAQIPLLELSEIDEESEDIPFAEDALPQGNCLLTVPLESNGILYAKFQFDASTLPLELLPYSGLLAEVLGKIDTEHHSFYDLPAAINQVFGGFSVQNYVYDRNAEQYRAFLAVSTKLFQEDLEQALQFVQEILLHSKFSVLDSLKRIVKSALISGENELLNRSHYFGILHSASRLFKGLYVDDLTSGIGYYHFLRKVNQLLEDNPQDVVKNLEKTAQHLFVRQNMELAIGCEEQYIHPTKQKITAFSTELPSSVGERVEGAADVVLHPKKMAFTNAGTVVYNVACFDYHKQGMPYHGKYKVLQTIINLEYLWNQVRVQGGAYGCGCNVQKNGLAYFYSYRDPNLKETYAVYQGLSRELAKFDVSEREMTKYILGTINRLEQPKTNMERLNTVISQYYKNITREFCRKERSEVLHTTAADIRNCKDLLQALDCDNICTIGSEQIITASADVFDEIKSLI